MKQLFKFALAIALLCSFLHAQKLNLATQTQGVLPRSLGGTGSTSAGVNGQVLICDGVSACAPGDPIVSFNYANLLTTQAATGTSVGAATRLSTFGAFGTLYVTFASITGSGTSCTVQLKNYDSLGNAINNGSAISVTPANGTTTSAVSPALALQTAAQMSATYACSSYPSAGTITVDFVPAVSVGIAGQVAISNFPASFLVSNFPATQPISAASLPLPTGAATSANQPTLVSGRTPVDPSGVTSPISAASLPLPTGAATSANQPALVSGRTPVDPSGVTSPISAASLPLPTGASTSAKQPALGTAGTPSVDVISIQGVTSMTPVKTDGSGVTQPVSASTLPLPTGAATAANQPALVSGRTPVDPSGVTSPISAASLPLPTGAAQDATLTGGTAKVQNTVQDATAAVSISSATCPGTGCVQLAMQGKQSAAVAFPSATWTGTIVFEQSIDGSNWVGVDVYSEATETWVQSFVCAATCSGNFWFEPLGALNAVRVRGTPWTSGTATGTLLASNQPMGTFEYQGNPGAAAPPNAIEVGGIFNTTQPTLTTGQMGTHQMTSRGGLIVAPGVDNTAANAWFSKVTDGTNTAAVKAASTAPVAADPAVVVSVSPNGNSVVAAGNGTVLSNQQAVTASAVALATNTCKRACVKALNGNTINIFVGPSGVTTGTGMELGPGQAVCMPVTNTNLLFVIASATGASVSWIATN
jgi:hypothetical protein